MLSYQLKCILVHIAAGTYFELGGVGLRNKTGGGGSRDKSDFMADVF